MKLGSQAWIQPPLPTATYQSLEMREGLVHLQYLFPFTEYKKLTPSAECHNWVPSSLHLRFPTIHVFVQFTGSPTTGLVFGLWQRSLETRLNIFSCTITDQGTCTTYIVYVAMCTKYSMFKLQALRPICDGLHATKSCLSLLPLYLPGPETTTAHIQLCFLPPCGCSW